MEPLGLLTDPFMSSIVAGLILPWIHAILDRPEWTPNRRRFLVLALAMVVSAVVWYAGVYPATWRLIVTQIGVIAGVAQTAFTILKQVKIDGISIIDWAGIVTPGGESYMLRHRGATTKERFSDS